MAWDYLLHWDLCYGIGGDQFPLALISKSRVFWSLSRLYQYLRGRPIGFGKEKFICFIGYSEHFQAGWFGEICGVAVKQIIFFVVL